MKIENHKEIMMAVFNKLAEKKLNDSLDRFIITVFNYYKKKYGNIEDVEISEDVFNKQILNCAMLCSLTDEDGIKIFHALEEEHEYMCMYSIISCKIQIANDIKFSKTYTKIM